MLHVNFLGAAQLIEFVIMISYECHNYVNVHRHNYKKFTCIVLHAKDVFFFNCFKFSFSSFSSIVLNLANIILPCIFLLFYYKNKSNQCIVDI